MERVSDNVFSPLRAEVSMLVADLFKQHYDETRRLYFYSNEMRDGVSSIMKEIDPFVILDDDSIIEFILELVAYDFISFNESKDTYGMLVEVVNYDYIVGKSKVKIDW